MAVHIIHLYHCDTGSPGDVYGLVEDLEHEARYPFRNPKELWCILERILPPARPAKPPKTEYPAPPVTDL